MKQKLLDIQLLYYQGHTPAYWFNAAKNSIDHPQVNLNVFSGTGFGPLYSRQMFIRYSNAPFLAWVDDDDLLIPKVIDECLTTLIDDPSLCGVFTNHYIINELGDVIEKSTKLPYERRKHFFENHKPFHFMIFRNEAAKLALNIPSQFHALRGGDSYLIPTYASIFGDWKMIPTFGYQWRRKSPNNLDNLIEKDRLMLHCNKIVARQSLITHEHNDFLNPRI